MCSQLHSHTSWHNNNHTEQWTEIFFNKLIILSLFLPVCIHVVGCVVSWRIPYLRIPPSYSMVFHQCSYVHCYSIKGTNLLKTLSALQVEMIRDWNSRILFHFEFRGWVWWVIISRTGCTNKTSSVLLAHLLLTVPLYLGRRGVCVFTSSEEQDQRVHACSPHLRNKIKESVHVHPSE